LTVGWVLTVYYFAVSVLGSKLCIRFSAFITSVGVGDVTEANAESGHKSWPHQNDSSSSCANSHGTCSQFHELSTSFMHWNYFP